MLRHNIRSLRLQQWVAWPYLQLMRPPNLLTAWADILAGYAVTGLENLPALPWLMAATIGLYGGGVVLNDLCDAKIDAIERPERPIPNGRIPIRHAAVQSAFLFGVGIASASVASPISGGLAFLIAVCAVSYDTWGKHRPITGPINMGICRGLNLLLGVSAVPHLLGVYWYLGLIPLTYITAVTTLSRGEVYGGKRTTGLFSLGLLGLIMGGLLCLPWFGRFNTLAALPFLALLAWRVLPPFRRAAQDPRPEHIRTAVKAGVLSLIILDATIAAGYAGAPYGMLVLVLLFGAAWLARLFAVT